MPYTPVRTSDFTASRDAQPPHAPPDPPLRSNAVIADAVEKAMRGMDVAKTTLIRQIRVDPTYAAGYDGSMLHARVRVELTLFFEPRPT